MNLSGFAWLRSKVKRHGYVIGFAGVILYAIALIVWNWNTLINGGRP